MIDPYLVVAEARSWVGTRWRHQQRLKGVACDCYGLILGVALNLRLPGADEAANDWTLEGYGREPDYEVALAACRRYLIEIPKEQTTLADILYMWVNNSRDPQHFAIVSADDPPYMIHAWATQRGVVENRIDEVWRGRVAHAFRYQGVGY